MFLISPILTRVTCPSQWGCGRGFGRNEWGPRDALHERQQVCPCKVKPLCLNDPLSGGIPPVIHTGPWGPYLSTGPRPSSLQGVRRSDPRTTRGDLQRSAYCCEDEGRGSTRRLEPFPPADDPTVGPWSRGLPCRLTPHSNPEGRWDVPGPSERGRKGREVDPGVRAEGTGEEDKRHVNKNRSDGE